jgi:hypothetical protein
MRPSEFLEEYYEKKKKEAQLPQQEISDEDINNAWEIFRIQNPNTIGGFQDQYLSFCFAIKWYREQLEKTKK